MDSVASAGESWVEELVQFLRAEPGVSAVRIDPDAQRVAVATIGNVRIAGLEEKLAETIAGIEAEIAKARAAGRAPLGFSVRQEGGVTVIGRDRCTTAESMLQWREMEWPEGHAGHGHAGHAHGEQ